MQIIDLTEPTILNTQLRINNFKQSFLVRIQSTKSCILYRNFWTWHSFQYQWKQVQLI